MLVYTYKQRKESKMQVFFILWFIAFIYALGGYLLTCLKEYELTLTKESKND